MNLEILNLKNPHCLFNNQFLIQTLSSIQAHYSALVLDEILPDKHTTQSGTWIYHSPIMHDIYSDVAIYDTVLQWAEDDISGGYFYHYRLLKDELSKRGDDRLANLMNAQIQQNDAIDFNMIQDNELFYGRALAYLQTQAHWQDEIDGFPIS